MTLLDIITLALLVIYVALGWFTGTIRRVIGLVAVYVAFLVGTLAGQQGASVLTQWRPNLPVVDARLYGYLVFFLAVVLIIEGMALAIHPHLQFAVVALDRGIGVLLGAFTVVVLVAGYGFLLTGYATPAGASAPDALEITVRDGISNSAVVRPIINGTGQSLVKVMVAVLPREPSTWFASV